MSEKIMEKVKKIKDDADIKSLRIFKKYAYVTIDIGEISLTSLPKVFEEFKKAGFDIVSYEGDARGIIIKAIVPI